jgi:ADP-ribosyl-[dinitrogen reductase] hydrolase
MTRSRYHGSLLGLATGDALGTTLEFRPRGTFTPIADVVGGGPFDLKPGEWTDDTSMALCLAESLTTTRRFDPRDQMERYVRWWKEGHWSVKGHCFDIGNTTRAALERFVRTGDPFAGSTDPRAAGNGSLMRLAPVPLAFARDEAEAVRLSGESSRTTHAAEEAVDACRLYAAMIVGALEGRSKHELLSRELWRHGPLAPKVAAIAAGSYKEKVPPAIRGTGYVVDALEAALWAFDNGATFEEGALLAVNLGDDADTTGAIYGQLAGAFYGVEGIPERWLAKVAMRDEIERLAGELFDLASSPRPAAWRHPSHQEGRPDPNTYWVREGRLLAGEYPITADPETAREKIRRYLDAGVTFFVDLTEENELSPYGHLLDEEAAARGVDVVHRRLSIRDLDVPRSRDEMARILDEIDAALALGHTVYVHCWGGIGRTGTVVGCHLVRHGLTGDEALAAIMQLWPTMQKSHRRDRSPETAAQHAWVRGWREG